MWGERERERESLLGAYFNDGYLRHQLTTPCLSGPGACACKRPAAAALKASTDGRDLGVGSAPAAVPVAAA